MSSMLQNSNQASIENSMIYSVGRDQSIQYNISIESKRSKLNYAVLETLKPVDRNGYNILPCMSGTRGTVLKGVRLWLDDFAPTTPNVMWISGSPGSGKSAIASTLVSELSSPGTQRLGSYFFFKRGDASLSDPVALWRTIATDLSQFHQNIHDSIVECLEKPGFRLGDINWQFSYLIKGVLEKYADLLKENPPVIIIDALDECGSDEAQKAYRAALLKTLEEWTCLLSWFKLIITSRDERIPDFFRKGRLCFHSPLETGDNTASETSRDIYRFFKESFSSLVKSLCLEPEWPGDAILQKLTARTAGLFIWAKTAIKFLQQDEGEDEPDRKLELLHSGDSDVGRQNLDVLYKQVLQYAFSGSTTSRLQLIRAVLACIVLAREPLYLDDLKYLLSSTEGWNDRNIKVIIQRLSSVISKRDTDGILQMRHLTFGEYITDREHCSVSQFYIDTKEHNYQITSCCLGLMNTTLRFNICNLETSHLPNSGFSDLPQRIKKNIPHWLKYSCFNWGSHFSACLQDEYDILLPKMWELLQQKFLYWIEVMSLLDGVNEAAWMLQNIAKLIMNSDSLLTDFVKDAVQFVTHFHIPLMDSAPHIYISALPFSPKSSKIKQQYVPQFHNTLIITEGLPIFWPTSFQVLVGHADNFSSVAYSPNGKYIVTGSHTIKIWNVETGQTVAGPFEGHTDLVSSVAYSPNGKLIVSGFWDNTVRIWDAETGQAVGGTFEGHTDQVTSVAYSSDGNQVASGSRDKTVRIWDVETGQTVAGQFEGHTGQITSVAYSPNRKRVASGSTDNTVKIWKVETGQTVTGPFEGHTSQISSVAYSPNGKYIVSGSWDNTVRIWDVETSKTVVGPFEGHIDPVSSVAYSLNGKYVVSGSWDNTVRIWDVETGQTVAGPFEGHTDQITSVVYSPDGNQVASSSRDKTVRIWVVEIGC